MEEQVIQETPVVSPEQPVVAVEDASVVDTSAVQAQYEQQLESLKLVLWKPKKNSKA